LSSFIKQFFLEPKSTGAVAAASPSLASCVTNLADLSAAKVVVELGPGNGVITERIVKSLRPDALFFALEINPSFVEQTRKRCPGVLVYHDSAVNLKKYLDKHGVKKCDCVISGLPYASFGKGLQEELMCAVVDSLSVGGKFLTIPYFHGLFLPKGKRFRDLLSSKFGVVNQSKVVWDNIPPAFVYHCRK